MQKHVIYWSWWWNWLVAECAYSLKATEKSDVYSMGIVLMELVSGKMPTDEAFGGGMDMVRWVEMNIEMHSQDLIDPLLLPLTPTQQFAAFQVLEVALHCTKMTPLQRPSSRQVCDLLLHVFSNRVLDFDKINLNTHEWLFFLLYIYIN